MARKIRVGEIPVVKYSSIEECLFDTSKESKEYLTSFKPETCKYDNEFAFIFKIKFMKKYFVVINAFTTWFSVEILSSENEEISQENLLYDKVMNKLSYNLKKALSTLKIYQNMRLKLSKRYFKMLFLLFKKSYKKLVRIYEYDYAHINKLLGKLENDNLHQGYYFLKYDFKGGIDGQ